MLICFDLDDTLLDHQGAERAAAIRFAETFRDRVPARGDAFVTLWRSASERHFEAFLRGACSFEGQRRRRICDLVGKDLNDAEADALFAVYLEAYEAHWRLFDDVLPCLGVLQGHQLGVITNAAQAQQERKLERLGVAHYFSFILSAESAGCAKPDPAIFALAATHARPADPRVYIGDNLELDAQAATAAGWHGIWLCRGNKNSRYPHTLRTLEALPAYVEKSGFSA